MTTKPSFKGIGSPKKVTLRTTPINSSSTDTTVTTQNPKPTTPSPRGHA